MRYILSAGRTGTVFLSHLINECLDGVHAAHEPGYSRYQMMLANLRNDWGIGGGLLSRVFESSRAPRERAAAGIYVEINPFLCPMTDLLPKAGTELRIVHLVRDPASWATSIATFKASTRFRHLIDAIPFAKPFPSPRPPGWSKFSDYERALWRWNWCNSRISALQPMAEAYGIIRFEDLVSTNHAIREAALDKIAGTLALPGKLRLPADERMLPTNPSSAVETAPDYAAAKRISGQMARRYGYDY